MKLTLTEAKTLWTEARDTGKLTTLEAYLFHLESAADRRAFAAWFVEQVEDEADTRRMVRRIAREVPEHEAAEETR